MSKVSFGFIVGISLLLCFLECIAIFTKDSTPHCYPYCYLSFLKPKKSKITVKMLKTCFSERKK